jgi:hypothetical protein
MPARTPWPPRGIAGRSRQYRAERRIIFLRSDAYAQPDAEALARRRTHGQGWDLATFPVRAGFEAHFYILSGPAQSSIWEAIRLIGSKP